MFVSLILATVGRVDEVDRCLKSLVMQTDRDFEVLIVDQNYNRGLDKTIEDGRTRGLEIRHLHLTPPNLSAARNLGIAEAHGDIVGFPDDDCWYEPTVIEQLRSAFEGKPNADAVVANWVEHSAAIGAGHNECLLSHRTFRSFREGSASSITLFLRRDLLIGLDGFDPRMGVGQWYGAGEETDLVLRALAAGYTIRRTPRVRVHHVFDKKGVGKLKDACRGSRSRSRGTGYIYAQHGLSYIVVLRGLVSPILVPLIYLRGFRALALGISTSLGRLEGFANRRREMRRGGASV